MLVTSTEVSTEPEDIPIYGPSESQESKQTTTNKRKKRRFGLNSEDIDKEIVVTMEQI